LGIVAVNIDQRDLIREELRRLSADDELVKLYREKTDEKGEDVFVKNLENVQGDERDFIFISLTRGREVGATAMKQRFGPINGKQGHRRLNVLFTRARSRIFLFASFGSVDVTPSETSSEGVHVLKRYLEYAETRGRSRVESIGIDADSDFEVEVRDRLIQRGYKVDLQIGVSGFRIDLGVRHPDHPERFLAGIECDGAHYHSSKSARDRDRLREQVLAGLGWDIVRVWSTDWFADAAVETDKLVKRLETLRARPPVSADEYEFARPAPAPGHMQTADATDPEPVRGSPEHKIATEPSVVSEPKFPEDSFTEKDCIKTLEEFRETIIAKEVPGWERQRSILRDAMIEAFVRQRLVDPDDWFNEIPQFLRMATNPLEKKLYLARVCEIVGRLGRVPGDGVARSGHRRFAGQGRVADTNLI
jgi:very-short-patch-repair endonuclease